MAMFHLAFLQLKRLLRAGAVIAIVAAPAWASLGGDEASIRADQVQMRGTRTVKTAQSYTVHEIQAANGVVVREYISPEGKVFGVAWNGPWKPDMRQLLGSNFEQYARANQSQNAGRMGRRPVTINEPGLVLQLGGHVRAFAGRAYVPEMLPSGVGAESIR